MVLHEKGIDFDVHEVDLAEILAAELRQTRKARKRVQRIAADEQVVA